MDSYAWYVKAVVIIISELMYTLNGANLENVANVPNYQSKNNHYYIVAYQPLPGLSCLYRPVGVLRSKNVGE